MFIFVFIIHCITNIIYSDLSPLFTFVLQCICLFYVVVNCPSNVLRQQRAVIPITSGTSVTVTSGASGAPVTSVTPITVTSGTSVTVTSGASVTSVTPVTTTGNKQNQGEERYVYTYLAN